MREALRCGSDDAVREVLACALRMKPEEHGDPNSAHATSTNMNQIGG